VVIPVVLALICVLARFRDHRAVAIGAGGVLFALLLA